MINSTEGIFLTESMTISQYKSEIFCLMYKPLIKVFQSKYYRALMDVTALGPGRDKENIPLEDTKAMEMVTKNMEIHQNLFFSVLIITNQIYSFPSFSSFVCSSVRFCGQDLIFLRPLASSQVSYICSL